MRTFVVILVLVVVLAGAGALGYQPAVYYWQLSSMPKWRTAEVAQGDIIAVRNSTGTIKPVLQISVGAFVSGPLDSEYQIEDLDGKKLFDRDGKPLSLAEFNQEVKSGQILAKIDPRIYLATEATRRADVERITAQFEQAVLDWMRADELRLEDPDFIAQAELDQVWYSAVGLQSQIQVGRAQLDLASANVRYTDIRSPVDGIIISRTIQPGQTLATQFQTPELFVVAPDMREKMHVHASVDEADIGFIKTAQERKLPVTFTVDTYQDTLFEGAIEEIRLSSTTTQNVVTYPVVVAAANPDLRLLPGMTANISFEVDRRDGTRKIPNAALRFFPEPQHVRKEDQALLEGKIEELKPKSANDLQETGLSAVERADARRKRNLRHVWVVDGVKLRAVEIVVGLADSRFTELVSGSLKLGDKLVTGIEPPKKWGG